MIVSVYSHYIKKGRIITLTFNTHKKLIELTMARTCRAKHGSGLYERSVELKSAVKFNTGNVSFETSFKTYVKLKKNSLGKKLHKHTWFAILQVLRTRVS